MMEDVIPMLPVQTQLVLTHVYVKTDILAQDYNAVVGCGTVLFNFTITGCVFILLSLYM